MLAPGLLLIVTLAADAAARRAASMARSPAAATADAQAAAATTLENSGLDCATLSLQVDAGGLTVPGLSGATMTHTATSGV